MTDDLLIKITESATQSAVRWQKRALKSESLLTPRRIDEDTPDGVLVWSGESWVKARRGVIGWRDSDATGYIYYPTWWLPMLPAPEEK